VNNAVGIDRRSGCYSVQGRGDLRSEGWRAFDAQLARVAKTLLGNLGSRSQLTASRAGNQTAGRQIVPLRLLTVGRVISGEYAADLGAPVSTIEPQFAYAFTLRLVCSRARI
jgi:hypothetical protein